jgi:hypothetical protein
MFIKKAIIIAMTAGLSDGQEESNPKNLNIP